MLDNSWYSHTSLEIIISGFTEGRRAQHIFLKVLIVVVCIYSFCLLIQNYFFLFQASRRKKPTITFLTNCHYVTFFKQIADIGNQVNQARFWYLTALLSICRSSSVCRLQIIMLWFPNLWYNIKSCCQITSCQPQF